MILLKKKYVNKFTDFFTFGVMIETSKLYILACMQTFLSADISFKLGMMIETTMVYILKSVWMTLTFIEGHSYKKSKTLVSNFLQI